MSEKLTRIRLPDRPRGDGMMDWGEHTVEDMIAQYRRYGAALRERADVILEAEDGDFQIDVVRGSCVQRHIKTLQQSVRKVPK